MLDQLLEAALHTWAHLGKPASLLQEADLAAQVRTAGSVVLVLLMMLMLFMMIVVVCSLSIVKLLIVAIILIVVLPERHVVVLVVMITATFLKSARGEGWSRREGSMLRWEIGEHLIMLTVFIVARYRVICVDVTHSHR